MSRPENTATAYVEQFERQGAVLAGLPAWLAERKRSAMQRFAEAGFPDPRHEEWRYTNVRPIVRKAFEPATGPAGPLPPQIDALGFAGLDAIRLVFADGRLLPDRSTVEDLPDGVTVMGLAQAIETRAGELAERLGAVADESDNSFASLNTAMMQDGAYVALAPGAVIERPIYLLFLSARTDQPLVAHPRILVHAGENSQGTVIEHYAGQGGAAGFTNTVTELLAAPGAQLHHYLLQEQSTDGYHVGSINARLMADARLVSHNVNLGGRLVRNDLNVRLAEPGAEATLNGLVMVDGRQHVDNHTRIHHAAPRTRSEEGYRAVADGHGRGVFKGRVLVDKGAQRIEAHQSSANLLLSDDAEIDTKPELEIYADDVACSHGATVGQLDEQALFYLRSRAIEERTARGLLVYAFADAVIERLEIPAIRERLEQRLVGRLPDSETLRDFV